MVDEETPENNASENRGENEEYEILPEKEIKELKEELKRLKEFEIAPSKKLHVSIVELNNRIDKLLSIFEEAISSVQAEEGGLSFKDKMAPLVEKMNKLSEQNAEIADAVVALADMIKEMREEISARPKPVEITGPLPAPPGTTPPPEMPATLAMPPPQGTVPPLMPPPGMPPLPPPRRRRF